MIRKITDIKNFAVFNDFNWDISVVNPNDTTKPLNFEKINIIYGYNYSGKTTISRILRSLETGIISDKFQNPSFSVIFQDGINVTQGQIKNHNKKIRVFNEDFVRDNLMFIKNPDANIESFAILGNDNKNLEQEILKLENEVGIKEEGQETGLYKQLVIDNINYNNELKMVQKAKNSLDSQLSEKAINRKFGIKYNHLKYGDQNYNQTKLNNDIKNVLSAEYTQLTETNKKKLEDLLLENLKPEISKLSTITLSYNSFCDKTKNLLSKKIETSDKITELLHDTVLNEWVKQGCKLHDGKHENCFFCGSLISSERWDILHKHFDDETKKLENEIASLLNDIKNEKETIEKGFDIDKEIFYKQFQENIKKQKDSYKIAINKYIQNLDSITIQLNNRLKNIANIILFTTPEDCSEEINSILKSYEEIRISSNKFSNDLNKEQDEAKTKLRLQEIYDFCSTIKYTEQNQNINGLDKKVKDAENSKNSTISEIVLKEKIIKEKKELLNDEGQGAIKVNKYLNNFFGNNFLVLVPVNTIENNIKRIHFEVIRNNKRAYHLSEGECSLISFCYFMAKLEDINTKGMKPIIWIDDPISSLDANHIFFVYSLIKAEIIDKGNFEQIFISTHSLEFLKYLKRLNGHEINTNGQKKEYRKEYLIVNRQGEFSTIQKMPKYLKEYATEFNYLFSCIYKCSQSKEENDENFELFYNFGNNVRKFLEIYLYFKYPDNPPDALERFFADKVPTILTERLDNEYSHCFIPRSSIPIIVPEMLKVAKYIIEKLKKEDEEQFNSLIKSISC